MPREVGAVPLIALVDVNAMFASCHQAEDSALRGLPLLVAGDPEDRRSIVLTASYEARAFGVRTAMPVRMAQRLCPGARIVAPDHALYRRYSRRLFALLEDFTPVVRPVSIDEAFLDLTGCPGLAQGATALGRAIRRRALEGAGLNVSVGLAPGPWLAKMAADLAKRQADGVLELSKEDLHRAIWPLPVEAFHGVGEKTARRMRALGIVRIGDLARAGDDLLKPLGRHGAQLQRLARGEEPGVLEDEELARSVSQELTFARDVDRPESLDPVLLSLADRVAHRLRQDRLQARGVTLKLRNRSFRNFTRQSPLPVPSSRTDALHRTALQLLSRMPDTAFPARLCGIAAIRLCPVSDVVPELFPDDAGRRRDTLLQTVTGLRQRFGEGVVLPAATLEGQASESRDRRLHGSSFGPLKKSQPPVS